MRGESAYAICLATLVQSPREKDVGGLRLTISHPRMVVAVLKMKVLEDDGRTTIRPGRNRHHSCAVRLTECCIESHGELEMSQMVRREKQFIAPRVVRQLGQTSDGRAAHQDMQRRACGQKSLGEGID